MLVEMRIPTDQWVTASLVVGQRPLPVSLQKVSGRAAVIAEWPISGPGHYDLSYKSQSGAGKLTVSVHPEKLSSVEFGQLLNELEHGLPRDVAIALQNLGGLAGVQLDRGRPSSLAEELQRVREAIHGTTKVRGLTQLLTELARDPYVRLRASTHWVRREFARRPSPFGLAVALRRPGNLAEDRKPVNVLDTGVGHSADVYENRIVRTFVSQVEQRARRLAVVLRLTDNLSLADEADALVDSVMRSKRIASFLNDVSALATPPSHVTMVLLKRPVYQAALKAYLTFQRRLSIRFETPALDAPLRELPYLYQLWATMYVIQELLEVGRDLGYKLSSQLLIGRDARGAFVRPMPDGQPVVQLTHPFTGRQVSLIPERRYSDAIGSIGLRTNTYLQRPDIAVEIRDPDGSINVVLFDPKYKVAEYSGVLDKSLKPLKADIDKMHAYRDAIRDQDGVRVVSFAAILYPGPTVQFTGGIGAIGAQPLRAPVLRSNLRSILISALGDTSGTSA